MGHPDIIGGHLVIAHLYLSVNEFMELFTENKRIQV